MALLCSGKIGFSVLCFVLWLGYTICLLVHTIPILKGVSEFLNSPNTSKELQGSLPQIQDTDYFLSWMKQFLTLLYLPQYLLCIVYGIAIVSALLDTVCKRKIRLQFITAFLNSVSSMLFFLFAGMTLFSIVLCILAVQLMKHTFSDMLEQMKTIQPFSTKVHEPVFSAFIWTLQTAGVEMPKVKELGSYIVTMQTAIKWLSAQFFFSVMMLLVYSFYFYYWPHSLRTRNQKKSNKLTANIDAEGSDDDL